MSNFRLNADEVKRHAGIEPYKKRLPELKESGSKKYAAKCRWHGDSEPSLDVYLKDGEWKWGCFPCKTGEQDVLTFVQRTEKVSFLEALKMVAAETGFAVEEQAETDFQYDAQKAMLRLGEAETFLTSRGILIEEAREAGLGVVDFPDPDVGKCVVIPYGSDSESGQPVVKMRSLSPKTKKDKFRHLKGAPSAHLLYGLKEAEETLWLNPDLWIVESELDCLMMRALSRNAISVSSATACLSKDGSFKFDVAKLQKLANDAERVFLALDQDSAGNDCAQAFQAVLPGYKTFRVIWPFEKGADSKERVGHKDIGELYTADPASFSERLSVLAEEAVNRPPAWRLRFRSRSEMEPGEIVFLIEQFLHEGNIFIGGNSGDGKTWVALSIAKALVTGKKLLGRFPVPQKQKVLYLVPEMGERAFRKRLEALQMPDDGFLCMTIQQGIMRLDDPDLAAAIKSGYSIVFLDTAIRFSDAESENDNSENANGLAKAFVSLRQKGALAVVAIHHSPKATAQKEWLSVELEDTLRGAGDIGAIADIVHYVRMLDDSKTEIGIRCVKPRDFEPVPPFKIQGRPWIDQEGDFKMVTEQCFTKNQEREQKQANDLAKVSKAVKENPRATLRELQNITGINKDRVRNLKNILAKTNKADGRVQGMFEELTPEETTSLVG